MAVLEIVDVPRDGGDGEEGHTPRLAVVGAGEQANVPNLDVPVVMAAWKETTATLNHPRYWGAVNAYIQVVSTRVSSRSWKFGVSSYIDIYKFIASIVQM